MLRRFYILIVIALVISSDPVFSQQRYGFDFNTNWEWPDLILYEKSSDLPVNNAIKYLSKNLGIQDGRTLFRKLTALDSLNEIKKIIGISLLDSFYKPNPVRQYLEKELVKFNEKNTFEGLVKAAETLVKIRSVINGVKYIQKQEFEPRIIKKIKSNVTINFDYTYSSLILQLLKKETIKEEDLIPVKEFCKNRSIGAEEYKRNLILARDTSNLFVVYKIINPYSFSGLGEILTHYNNYAEILQTIIKNEKEFKFVILNVLSQYIPEDLFFNYTVYFSFGCGKDFINTEDNNLIISIEKLSDVYNQAIKLITREAFLEVKNKISVDIYPYLTEDRDSLFLKLLNGIHLGGMTNYIAPIVQENRPLSLLEKDFFLFRNIIYAINKNKRNRLIDSLIITGFKDGGPFYSMGTQMAYTIDKILGRKVLRDCMKLDAINFFKKYIEAYEQEPEQIRTVFRFYWDFETKIDSLSENFSNNIILGVINLALLNKYRFVILYEKK